MALIKCKECGNEVAKSADACPKCGAKTKARTGCLTWIVGGFFALVVIGMVGGSLESGKREEEQQRQTAEQRKQEQAEKRRVAAMTPEQKAEFEKQQEEKRAAQQLALRRQQGTAWNYDEQTDQMSKKTTRWALVKSLNEVEFDFPYKGRQRATLQFRVHPRYGHDAMLSIERGQFNCGIDDCAIRVRFGDGEPQVFSVGEPDDHSTTTLFIHDYSRFLAALRKVKTVHIEAPFYQEGNQVFEFAVDGLEWK